MKNQLDSNHPCPCGSCYSYGHCCQPYIEQDQNAPTAEALMRSRYTAFSLNESNYLRYSWHPDFCPIDIHLNENTIWLGLKIKNTKAGSESDKTGEVEFVAVSKNKGKANRMHENSRFCRYNSRWVYLDGDFLAK